MYKIMWKYESDTEWQLDMVCKTEDEAKKWVEFMEKSDADLVERPIYRIEKTR